MKCFVYHHICIVFSCLLLLGLISSLNSVVFIQRLKFFIQWTNRTVPMYNVVNNLKWVLPDTCVFPEYIFLFYWYSISVAQIGKSSGGKGYESELLICRFPHKLFQHTYQKNCLEPISRLCLVRSLGHGISFWLMLLKVARRCKSVWHSSRSSSPLT